MKIALKLKGANFENFKNALDQNIVYKFKSTWIWVEQQQELSSELRAEQIWRRMGWKWPTNGVMPRQMGPKSRRASWTGHWSEKIKEKIAWKVNPFKIALIKKKLLELDEVYRKKRDLIFSGKSSRMFHFWGRRKASWAEKGEERIQKGCGKIVDGTAKRRILTGKI